MKLTWNHWGRYQLPSACKVRPVEMTCTFSLKYLLHLYHGKLPKSWAFCLSSTYILRDYHRPNSTQRWKSPRQWTMQQQWREAHKGIPISIQWTDQHNGRRTLHNIINGKCPAIQCQNTLGSPFCLLRETTIGVGLTSTARYHSPSSTTHRIVSTNSGGPKERNRWHQTVCRLVKAQ